MRGALIAVLVLAAAAGCSADPKAGRLRAGDRVVLIVERRDGRAADRVAVYTRRAEDPRESEVVGVPAGTRAVVLGDAGPLSTDRTRWVQVKVDEGEHAGTVGEVARGWIRPAR